MPPGILRWAKLLLPNTRMVMLGQRCAFWFLRRTFHRYFGQAPRKALAKAIVKAENLPCAYKFKVFPWMSPKSDGRFSHSQLALWEVQMVCDQWQQHIRELLLCREVGSNFHCALTSFVNMILAGRCPSESPKLFWWPTSWLLIRSQVAFVRQPSASL